MHKISNSYKLTNNTLDKKYSVMNENYASYHLLERIEIHAELTYASIKEKGFNFLVQMGLGVFIEKKDRSYGNNFWVMMFVIINWLMIKKEVWKK